MMPARSARRDRPRRTSAFILRFVLFMMVLLRLLVFCAGLQPMRRLLAVAQDFQLAPLLLDNI